MDWERVTAEWVEEGLIEPSQRPALQTWLETRATDRSSVVDSLLPGLIAVGTWLVTGSTMVVVDLVAKDVSASEGGWVLLGLGALQLLGAGAARIGGIRAVAHGLASAGWVVVALALETLLPSTDEVGHVLAAAAMLGIGGLLGAAERMPGLAFAGAVGALLAVEPAIDGRLPFVGPALLVGCLLVTAALSAAIATSERNAPLGVLVSTPTFLALIELVQLGTKLFPQGWHWLGGATTTAIWGVMLIVASAASRSRWIVAATIATWGIAECCALFQVGSPLLAAIVLGSEGLGLFGVVAVWMVARVGRERRSRPSARS